jgi:hypothetical protein
MRSRCCVCVCVCVCVSVYHPSLLDNVSVKKTVIVARQRLGKNPHIVSRQRLGRNATAVTNTHATTEELFDASFLMCPVSYQGK